MRYSALRLKTAHDRLRFEAQVLPLLQRFVDEGAAEGATLEVEEAWSASPDRGVLQLYYKEADLFAWVRVTTYNRREGVGARVEACKETRRSGMVSVFDRRGRPGDVVPAAVAALVAACGEEVAKATQRRAAMEKGY